MAQHTRRYVAFQGCVGCAEKAKLTEQHLAAKLQVTHVWVHKSEIGERRVDITEFKNLVQRMRRPLRHGDYKLAAALGSVAGESAFADGPLFSRAPRQR